MNCGEARDTLTRNAAGRPDAVARHLENCPACARYAARLDLARDLLQSHHARVEPDDRFADRVTAGLRPEAAEVLTWAAVRMLPATLALLAVLAWLTWQPGPVDETLATISPTEDLLSWTLEQAGDGS